MDHLVCKYPCLKDKIDTVAYTCELRSSGKQYLLASCVRCLEINAIRIFCEKHKELVNIVKKSRRRVVFLYDCTQLELNASDIGVIIETVKDFVNMHISNKQWYVNNLVCTFIFVDNDVVSYIMNSILESVYTPTRPLKLISKRDIDGNRMVQELLSQCEPLPDD